MSSNREFIRKQMHSQRPTRKRQLYEVAPSPPKKWKSTSPTDSPLSSPSKGPLVENSDDELLPSFRVKSFYGSRRKLLLTKPPAVSPSPESPVPVNADLQKAGTKSNTRMPVRRTARGRSRSGSGKGTKSGRVALSPIKNVINSVKEKPKAKSKRKGEQKRSRSVPAKPISNANTEHQMQEATTSSDGDSSGNTPKNRKFFKHKSPASASKMVGGIIVGKGFNLKFLRGSLSSSFGKSPGRKTGIAVTPRSTPRVQKTYSRLNSARAEVRKDSLTSSPRDTGSLSSSSENPSIENAPLQWISEEPKCLHTLSGRDDSIGCDESGVASSQSLVQSDSQSILPESIDSLPVDDSKSGSSLSSQSENSHGKYYSIFGRKRRSLQADPDYSPSNSKTSSNSPAYSQKRKFITTKGDDKQLMLDAGQEKFGAVQCDVCGMVYTPADGADEATHNKFHQSALSALKFPGWKKERVIKDFLDDGSRIIAVLPDDQRFMVKKVEEVNRVMGQELGYPDHAFSFHGSYKAFLYISDEKRVEGCCIAESITQGYRILPNKDSSDSQRPWFCSNVPEPACVGIGRLWVYGPSRSRGIATRLVDSIRQWFEYGIMMKKSQLAFSDPTPDGRKFAAKYTGTPNFLVYKYNL